MRTNTKNNALQDYDILTQNFFSISGDLSWETCENSSLTIWPSPDVSITSKAILKCVFQQLMQLYPAKMQWASILKVKNVLILLFTRGGREIGLDNVESSHFP
jgi:hypothetical protein